MFVKYDYTFRKFILKIYEYVFYCFIINGKIHFTSWVNFIKKKHLLVSRNEMWNRENFQGKLSWKYRS